MAVAWYEREGRVPDYTSTRCVVSRPHPYLKVTRRQLPIAPAFAMTAHAAQGQTMLAAIVDLQIGAGTSSIGSYVALTRVARREDLLIYRAFERSLFTKKTFEGAELLLKVLKFSIFTFGPIKQFRQITLPNPILAVSKI